ncbi:MAG TPA: TolC family protein [Myxococcaceae bacterium]|nr:TolC family protein [Myxococcaceae bacterium]
MPSLLCLVLLQISQASPTDAALSPLLQPDPPDPVLSALVAETLAASPDHARARAEVSAERERVPQAGALADPTLVLGIQNDGFKSIQIGVEPTSFWQVLLNVPLSWPGKRGFREDAASARVTVAEAALQRVRLGLLGEVERAYLELRLVRGRLALQGRLESLWQQAEEIARIRYQVGEVPQSDLLRAQLERTRLRLQRLALEASERSALHEVNRLRVHPLDEAVETPVPLTETRPAPLPPAEALLADAEARSPDLALASRNVTVAEARVRSAYRERWPDLSLTAAIMPRGQLEPMWAASVGLSLPIYWWDKGSRAVDEAEQVRAAEQQGTEAVRQLLALRTRERHTALAAVLEALEVYRHGLLVQSDATVRSTLFQYRVGKVPFASVLEVMRGLVVDEGGYLAALADAERLWIGLREVSLQSPSGVGAGASGGSVPGASTPTRNPTAGAGASAASAPAPGM